MNNQVSHLFEMTVEKQDDGTTQVCLFPALSGQVQLVVQGVRKMSKKEMFVYEALEIYPLVSSFKRWGVCVCVYVLLSPVLIINELNRYVPERCTVILAS